MSCATKCFPTSKQSWCLDLRGQAIKVVGHLSNYKRKYAFLWQDNATVPTTSHIQHHLGKHYNKIPIFSAVQHFITLPHSSCHDKDSLHPLGIYMYWFVFPLAVQLSLPHRMWSSSWTLFHQNYLQITQFIHSSTNNCLFSPTLLSFFFFTCLFYRFKIWVFICISNLFH